MRVYRLAILIALAAPLAYSSWASSPVDETAVLEASANEGDADERLRARVVELARQLVGHGYHPGGETPDGGFDCSGLVRYAFSAVDRALGRSSRAQATEGVAVPLAEARPGDIVVFARVEAPERVFHAGLITEADDGRLVMVHANRRRGVHATDILASAYWREKVAGVRRVL